MSRKLKVAMLLLGLGVILVFVLWLPYESGSVPQWKVQVFDQNGNVAVGAPVNQEWLDPIDDGMVFVDSPTTDVNGFVLFPKRVLRNRLALGIAHAPSSRITVCRRDQFGGVDWDGKPTHLATQLVLRKGDCPYG